MLVAAVVVAAGLFWLDRWLFPPPLEVSTSGADLAPWPAPLRLEVERTIVGSPSVSVASAPPLERLYIVLRAEGIDIDVAMERAVEHLEDSGWEVDRRGRGTSWYDHVQLTSPDREYAYLGPLASYLASTQFDDWEAPEYLDRVAGRWRYEAILVQVFAGPEGDAAGVSSGGGVLG